MNTKKIIDVKKLKAEKELEKKALKGLKARENKNVVTK